MAGPGGDMSWLSGHLDAADPRVHELVSSVGALLIGRRTFDGDDPNAGTEQEGAFNGQYQGRAVVLTHRPPTHQTEGIEFHTDLMTAVNAAREVAQGKYVNVLGGDVGRQCLRAGLVDEVLVYVAPVLLGDGIKFFAEPGGARLPLEPIEAPYGGFHYRVLK